MSTQDNKFIAGRVDMVKAGYKARYGNREFIGGSEISALIALLLNSNNVERMLKMCEEGQAPLLAVVKEIEDFAEQRNLLENGVKKEEWRKNVGRLVGTIVYFAGYEAVGKVSFENQDNPPKYFRSASKYNKRIIGE